MTVSPIPDTVGTLRLHEPPPCPETGQDPGVYGRLLPDPPTNPPAVRQGSFEEVDLSLVTGLALSPKE